MVRDNLLTLLTAQAVAALASPIANFDPASACTK